MPYKQVPDTHPILFSKPEGDLSVVDVQANWDPRKPVIQGTKLGEVTVDGAAIGFCDTETFAAVLRGQTLSEWGGAHCEDETYEWGGCCVYSQKRKILLPYVHTGTDGVFGVYALMQGERMVGVLVRPEK